MRRREFMAALGGTAVGAVSAQAQSQRPIVAVLMALGNTDPEGRARLAGFLEGMQQLGWVDGQNVRIEIRWAGGSAERTREIVTEFVQLRPHVIVSNGTPATHAFKRATSSIPVVFVLVNEPVAQGVIASIARPGENITGFTMVDFSLVGKSIEMLRSIAPAVSRVGLMFNPESYPYYDVYLRALQADAPGSGIEVIRLAVRSPAEIEAAVSAFAASPGGGLAIPPDPFTVAQRAIIIAAVKHHRVPHVFAFRQLVREGALMSYGPDTGDIFRRSASYVDRILKGGKPAELPAQAPNKFELAINLQTASALGLNVPPALLSIADEVIE